MIRCVLLDDEPLALDIIETYLLKINNALLVAKFTNPVECFTYLQGNTIDLLFLDLNMPMLNGMELLKNLSQRPSVIITTAYRDFAVESFELDVVDYLVKPFSFPRFLKAFNKVIFRQPVKQIVSEHSERGIENDSLWLKVDKKMVSISPRDICYIQSLKDYVRVVTNENKFVIYHTLHSLHAKLPQEKFLRIHKSFVVQKSKITSIEGNMVYVLNEQLPIGRNYRKAINEILKLKNDYC